MLCEAIIQHNSVLSCPRFHPVSGQLYVSSPNTGSLLSVDLKGKQLNASSVTTKGILSSYVFDTQDDQLYICDLGHQAILLGGLSKQTEQSGDSEQNPIQQVSEIVRDYEGKVFKGPTDIEIDDESGTMFFTDGGPLGETNLQNATGSLYMITGGELLQPLTFESLAYPSCLSLQNGGCIFVGEMMRNRILRFIKTSDNGVFQFSVFKQLSGRIGPSAMCIDKKKGLLYVACYDSKKYGSKNGLIVVLDCTTGKEVNTLQLKGSPEINGICLSPDGKTLYGTEKSKKILFQCPL